MPGRSPLGDEFSLLAFAVQSVDEATLTLRNVEAEAAAAASAAAVSSQSPTPATSTSSQVRTALLFG